MHSEITESSTGNNFVSSSQAFKYIVRSTAVVIFDVIERENAGFFKKNADGLMCVALLYFFGADISSIF